MTTVDSSSAPPDAVEPKPNVFSRFAGALFAPVDTFRSIARRPDILYPMLILIALGIAVSVVIVQKMDFDALMAMQAEQLRERQPNMSAADIERAGRIGAAIARAMAYVGPILGVLWYVLLAAVLLFSFRLFGGEGTFKQSVSATLYAQTPLVINSLILAIVAFARGSIDPTQMATVVKSNPAFLVEMKEQPALFSLLSSLDVFTIWTVVLLIIGCSEFSGLSRGKSAALVISLWIVLIVIKTGFAAVTA